MHSRRSIVAAAASVAACLAAAPRRPTRSPSWAAGSASGAK